MNVSNIILAAEKHYPDVNIMPKTTRIHYPGELKLFYSLINPAGIEMMFNGCPILFIDAADIECMNKEYKIEKDSCVFATSNGDPVFWDHGMIKTFAHGAGSQKYEILSDSFDQFIRSLTY